MSEKVVRIAIVEDERLIAEAIRVWLSRRPEYCPVGQAYNAEEGRRMCLALRPDLAIVDLKMPGRDGIDLAQELLSEIPGIRILAISGFTDPYTIWRVWQSGLHGFIDKTQTLEQLNTAIHAVMEKGSFYSDRFQEVKEQWLAQPEAFQKVLSDREQDVLKRLVIGWDDNRIGQKLGIAQATVAFHRKSIRKKLSLHNDRELIAYGRLWGFC